MKRTIFLLLFLIPVVTVGCLTSQAFSRSGSTASSSTESVDAADVTFYADGIGKLEFDFMPEESTFYIPFKGTTEYGILWLKIQKSGEVEHSMMLDVEDSEFDVYYPVKEGPGEYDVTVYGAASSSSTRYKGLCVFSIDLTEETPDDLSGMYLNDEMIEYVDENMGVKIGRGECWDVAQDFLDGISADWTRPVDFGLELDPEVNEILPGDIIQFKSVQLYEEWDTGYSMQTLGAPDHTAVVYEVIDDLHYMLAHQNVGGDRFIVVTEVNLNNMTSGQVWFYRPMAGLISADDWEYSD